jgi:hypothetical protein
MTPLDALEVRRHLRANHPNRLALPARDPGFPSVAAMAARADAIYADPAKDASRTRPGRSPTPILPTTSASHASGSSEVADRATMLDELARRDDRAA